MFFVLIFFFFVIVFVFYFSDPNSLTFTLKIHHGGKITSFTNIFLKIKKKKRQILAKFTNLNRLNTQYKSLTFQLEQP